MSRVKPLSDNQIKALKPQDKEYKIADGDGLYLHIKPTGSKLWRMRYSLDKKSTTMSLGAYPTVSLKDARKKREEIRVMVSSGINPNKKKDTINRTTFKEASKEYLDLCGNLSEQYVMDCKNILKRDYEDEIGDMMLDDIEAIDIIRVLKSMEDRGIKTMTKKSFSLVSRVFKYAITMQYTKNNPTRDIDLAVALKKHQVKQFAHTTDTEVLRQLLLDIDNYEGDIYTRTALQLMPYVFLRPANVRGALWDEFDFDKKLWTIPAEKMKTKKDHIVPLTKSMIKIIKHVDNDKSKYLFPSPQSSVRQMSENTLNVALKRMGYKDIMTSHGFRHTASTILHENIHKHNVPSDVIEMQLAHIEKNSVKGVYNKALYIDERIKLMQWWSDYLDFLKL